MDGKAGYYDHIYLADSIANLDTVTEAVLAKTEIRDKPNAEQLAKCWDNLASRDALLSAPAQRMLLAADKDTLTLLKERMKRRETTDEDKKIIKLIAELDDDDFGVRQSASTQLGKIGEKADPFLRTALATTSSLEARRRIEALLGTRAYEDTISTDQLQQIRAIRVLEQIGTPQARDLVEALSKDC